jgi:CelD/BcsL family acetyltransferase involved in cellulose biosynthesis
MYSVELVTDKAAFLRLRDVWNETVDRAGIVHPFLRHEWFSAWWDAFGSDYQLHILLVKAGSRLCAIAPLMFERAQMYGMPIRLLRFMQNDHTPRADLIVADQAEDSYRTLWHALLHEQQRWDVLQLSQLPEDSVTRAAFRALADEGGHANGLWHSGAAPYVKLPSTWEEYCDSLTPKFRQNLRNRMNRLTQLGEPALELLSDERAIRDGREDAQRLEDSGWKQRAGTAIGSNPAVQRFYTLLAERAAECSWLRLLFLSVNGQRIAGSYAAIYQNRLFLLKTGYDPAFSKCSPFKLLTYFTLRHACESGLSEVDFLGDPEPWKLEWTSTARPHDWLFVFSRTPRARLLHPLKFQFVPALRRLRESAACTFQPSRA